MVSDRPLARALAAFALVAGLFAAATAAPGHADKAEAGGRAAEQLDEPAPAERRLAFLHDGLLPSSPALFGALRGRFRCRRGRFVRPRPSAPALRAGGARSRGAAYLHTLVQHSARVVDFYANETFSPRCGPRAAAAAWPGLEGTASGSRLAGPQTRREVPDRGHAHAVGCQHRGHRHGVLPDVPPALFRRGILCGQGHSRR